MSFPLEIVCSACGKETFIRREPVYEGFRKTGEQLFCATCGYEYASEDELPCRESGPARLFDEGDRSPTPAVFEGTIIRNCRRCRHYVVNPFKQMCGLHRREVQATDCCSDFAAQEEESGPETG